MGSEKAVIGHVACSAACSTASQQRRKPENRNRARRTKNRRAAANHNVAQTAAPVADANSRCPLPLEEAARATEVADVTAPPPCETRAEAEANVEVALAGCEMAEVPELPEVPKEPLTRASSCPDLGQYPEEDEVINALKPRLRRGRTWPLDGKLKVSFDDEVSVHTITPYAEVYGMHPRLFDFAKGFSMVPAQGFGAARQALIAAAAALAARRARGEDASLDDLDDEDEEEEDEDEFFSEDDWSDDNLCTEIITEYHLAPPLHFAHSAPILTSC